MGCSNPHPHGQIWAGDWVPSIPSAEDRNQRAFYEANHRRLLEDYEELERQEGTRVVEANDDWLLLVPYWAVWPFETLLLARGDIQRLEQLGERQQASLAGILQRGLQRYDALFGVPFPYSMGWHGAPGGEPGAHWLLHAHFYPPLLRSATVRKYMVGYEMLADAQRDLTPEQAAEKLRRAPVDSGRLR